MNNARTKIRQVEEIMDLEEGILSMDTRLDSLEEWDSLAVISLLALLDRSEGKSVDMRKIKQAVTVGDLVDLL